MGPALYVIAILGCGEGEAPCEQVRLADARFESREACAAATGAQLERHADLAFPVVVAQCRRADARPEPVRADSLRLPDPEANPHYRQARAE